MPPRRQAQLARKNADMLTSTTIDISSAEVARDLRIGVVLGGPSEEIVKRLGFSHIEAVASVESNARKLAIGRVDAWAVARGTLLYAQRYFQGLPAWRTGATLGGYSMYFGGTAGMDLERAKLWRQAFASLKRDGRYASILRAYQYAVPGEPYSTLLSGR